MTALGSFPVEATAAEVEAFRAATGLDPADPAVPLTFPMRWMVAPEVVEATRSMVPEPDLVLVHEGQTFDYERPLEVGLSYSLELSAKRQTAPDRLVLDGTIAAIDGPLYARLETVIRLFSMNQAPARPGAAS